jgi:hypothetical protein
MSAVMPGIYQHYKGNRYRVICEAKHSETLDEFVVYEALYDNTESKIWVRPKKMFLEEVEVEGQKIPRFTFISENEHPTQNGEVVPSSDGTGAVV